MLPTTSPLATEFSTLSTSSTRSGDLGRGIYPQGSWLERYMDYARAREESADSYLIGAILPVVAATLARRVSFAWGDRFIFPNLFAMLAGKPGDRKSSAIDLAERFAKASLEDDRFLSHNLSGEALFDEYAEENGGAPDKLLICDDANAFFAGGQSDRIAKLLLRLFDCKGLTEAFRRNMGEGGGPRRSVPETSTSVVFGATWNICQFQGQQSRDGLQRRFNYYLAEKHGRFLSLPAQTDASQFAALAAGLGKMSNLSKAACQFSDEAKQIWDEFQGQNRQSLQQTGVNQEALASRLNGQPTQVLKLAMVFQASIWAESADSFSGVIEPETLQAAIEHSNHCVASGEALASLGRRASIQSDADVLLAKIQIHFGQNAHRGEIELTRSQLTGSYAHHSARKGALTTDHLYLHLIPNLIDRGLAREISRRGKQPAFRFLIEPNK